MARRQPVINRSYNNSPASPAVSVSWLSKHRVLTRRLFTWSDVIYLAERYLFVTLERKHLDGWAEEGVFMAAEKSLWGGVMFVLLLKRCKLFWELCSHLLWLSIGGSVILWFWLITFFFFSLSVLLLLLCLGLIVVVFSLVLLLLCLSLTRFSLEENRPV